MKLTRRARTGLQLMEVDVASVIVAVLAAATVPSLSEFMSGRDANLVASQLSQIGAGVASFKGSVFATASATGNTYPRFISQLTTPITTADRNSCSAAHSAN